MRALVISLLTLTASTSYATPSEILMIRHAEKPTSGPEGSDLSPRGYKRAAALSELFTSDARVTALGVASFIFAGAPKKTDGSQRPLETIQPTANKLGLTVDVDFQSEDYDSLANELLANPKYDSKVVIICWPHDQLPDFANSLGVKQKLGWKGSVFDRVWKLDFVGGKLANFEDLPQHLLKGDSSK